MGFRWRALLALVLVAFLGIAARHLRVDDALIYARYVRNCLAGHGLVFNPGERVNALTSPLYTYLLLALSWLLRGHVLLAEWLLGVGFLAATVLLAESLVPLSGILLAASIYFDIFLGMETSLFCFLLLLCIALTLRNQWNWLPFCLVLLALARFEGAALAAIVCWHMVRQHRCPRWHAWLAALAVVAVYLCFNLHLYGKLLPSSGLAKLQHGLSGYWGQWPTAFFRVPRVFWRPLVSFSYAIPLAAWLAWRGAHSELWKPWNELVLPFCGALLGFYVFANVPGYPWYYAPFVMFGLIYAARGLPETRKSYAVLSLILLHFTLGGAYLLVHAGALYAPYQRLAAWLNTHAAPGATVAAVETGTLGWYCDHKVIDIVGLTTPQNAELLAHHDAHTWLKLDKPDYVVMHTPPTVGEAAVLSSMDYERVPDLGSGVYLERRIAGK